MWMITVALMVHWPRILSQDCNLHSDTSQCSDSYICRNRICETAMPCTSGADCVLAPCVADYCQPEYCTATGQCVHGQKCSQNTASRACVYIWKLATEENMETKLSFPEPGSGGPYAEVTWYKERTGSSKYRIVFLHPSFADGKPLYFNDYCSDSSPCVSSSEGELNPNTGTFTIYNSQIPDEGFYYYQFYISGGSPDTGHKYEIELDIYVSPKQKDIVINGITDEIEEKGKILNITCTINRIRPEAADIYWLIVGSREDGTLQTEGNRGGFKQTNTLEYTVTEEDVDKPIVCVVIPVHGDKVEVQRILNPLPTPSPSPASQEKEDGNVNIVLIIGIAVVVVFIIIALTLAIILCRRLKKKRSESSAVVSGTLGLDPRSSNYDQIKDEDVKDNLGFDEEVTSVSNMKTKHGNSGFAEVQKNPHTTNVYEEVNDKQSKKNSRVDSNYDDIGDSNYETIDEDVDNTVDDANDDNYDDYLKPVTNVNNDLVAMVDAQGVNTRKQTRSYVNDEMMKNDYDEI